MKLFYLLILFLLSHQVNASEFSGVDAVIGNVIINWLNTNPEKNNGASNNLVCKSSQFSFTSLKSCHDYIKGIYITEDTTSYMTYVKQLLSFGIDIEKLPVYHKLLLAKYDGLTSELFYEIAYSKYLYQEYDQAIDFLKKIDSTLGDDSVYHAILIYGLIYFEKKEFKKASQYFNRIDRSSRYYAVAQYNMGLISMRSLWWSDAESYLNNAISFFDINGMDAQQSYLLDKLYLTIGYSQISRNDFRSSKSSFSNVSIESPMKMRALMGIALSEIGLGNLGRAATILKLIIKNSSSLEKLDSLVTLPQVYHKSNNMKDSTRYYEAAITTMNSILKKLSDVVQSNTISTSETGMFNIHEDYALKGVRKRELLVEQLLAISSISRADANNLHKISLDLSLLRENFIKRKTKTITLLVKSYIKQSKYALAVIYDNSVVVK